MFNSIAKRQLEKEVIQLVQSKGAAWCCQSQAVQAELLKNHPKQQIKVDALYHVVMVAGLAYLMSLPDPTTDEAAHLRVVQRVQGYGTNAEDAQWAVQCWAAAIAALPYQQRVETLNQIKAQFELQRQAKVAEEERRKIEATNAALREWQTMEEARRRREEQESQRKEQERFARDVAVSQEATRLRAAIAEEAEKKRRQPLIECWRLAFPREASAIQEAADLVAQSQVRAEAARLQAKDEDGDEDFGGRVMTLGRITKAEEQERARVAERVKVAERAKVAEMSATPIENEIWRRISTAPDQGAMQRTLEAAGQAEAKRRRVEAERCRVEAEHNRKVAEETQKRRQAQEERAQKQASIQSWRQQFPLQCAGIDDEEVWKQIPASLNSSLDRSTAPTKPRNLFDRFEGR